jgi:hypothetical protein
MGIPDAEIFPHATGLAQKTVEKQEEPFKVHAGTQISPQCEAPHSVRNRN